MAEEINNKINEKNDDEDDFDSDNFVRVPTMTRNKMNEPIREFTTYKIIKRLEY